MPRLSLIALLVAASAVPALAQSPAGNAVIPVPLQPVIPAEQRTCTAKTASGLGYSALQPGSGAKVGPSDYVLVNYIGYLAATGAVFDQATNSTMTVDGVVPGFGEGLQLVPKGGIMRICLPAALGYGAQATGPIPANSDLVFQIELVDSRTVAEVAAMRAEADKAAPASGTAKP